MEPIFPIEILSEIANVYPFDSFMRYLNKDTRKYWKERTIFTTSEQTLESKKPELAIAKYLTPMLFKKYGSIKYLKISLDSDFEHMIPSISNSSVTHIDLSNRQVFSNVLSLLPRVRFFNFYSYVLKDRGDKFPDICNIYDACPYENFAIYIQDIKGETRTVVHSKYESVLNFDEHIRLAEHIDINFPSGRGLVLSTILEVLSLPKLKTCRIRHHRDYATIRKKLDKCIAKSRNPRKIDFIFN